MHATWGLDCRVHSVHSQLAVGFQDRSYQELRHSCSSQPGRGHFFRGYVTSSKRQDLSMSVPNSSPGLVGGDSPHWSWRRLPTLKMRFPK